MTTRTSIPKGSYVFEVHLAEFPACVRILQIPANQTFLVLAYSIVKAFFGGLPSHMWEFPISGKPYNYSKGVITFGNNEEFYYNDRKEIQATKYHLHEYFEKENNLLFVYDLGDDWFFTIKCVRFLPIENKQQPTSLKTRRAVSRIMKERNVETQSPNIKQAVVLYQSLPSPIEDIGGMYGYDTMLEQIYMLADNLDAIPNWYQTYQDNSSDDEAMEKLYEEITTKLQQSCDELNEKRNNVDVSTIPMLDIDRDVIDWDYYNSILIDACKKNKEMLEWFVSEYIEEPAIIAQHLADQIGHFAIMWWG